MQNKVTWIKITEFLTQLKSEFYGFEIPDENFGILVCESQREMSKFTNWIHTWNHTVRVTSNALYLVKKESANQNMCFLSGIFHDVYKLDESDEQGHGIKSAEFAEKILREFNENNDEFKFNDEFIRGVVNAVKTHTNGVPETLEAKILWDADKLDKIGASGLMRRVVSKKYTEEQLIARLRSDIVSTIFYLNTSKELANLRKAYLEKVLHA